MNPAAALALAALVGPVELRGGDVVTAPIESITLEGVRVGGEEPRIIAWDSVRRVTGDGSAKAGEFAEVAERAWRARLRLARGDHALAAPLFEDLWTTYREASGPTALMIAEGTLACRLATGRSADAIEPWLRAVSLREKGVEIAGDPRLTPVIDGATMLVPALAPIWLDGRSAQAAIEESWLPRTGVAGELATLFAASSRFQSGGAGAGALPGGEGKPGVALVALMVESIAPEAARREAARFAMRGRLDQESGTWREAWLRAALGRSYLLEADARARMVGVFHLMHLPSRFAWSHPHLAAMALAVSARELRSQGDASGADALRAELVRMFPGAREIAWLDAQSENSVQPDPAPAVDPVPDAAPSSREQTP